MGAVIKKTCFRYGANAEDPTGKGMRPIGKNGMEAVSGHDHILKKVPSLREGGVKGTVMIKLLASIRRERKQ